MTMRNMQNLHRAYGGGKGLHALHVDLRFHTDSVLGYYCRRKAGEFAQKADPRCGYGNLMPEWMNDIVRSHQSALSEAFPKK